MLEVQQRVRRPRVVSALDLRSIELEGQTADDRIADLHRVLLGRGMKYHRARIAVVSDPADLLAISAVHRPCGKREVVRVSVERRARVVEQLLTHDARLAAAPDHVALHARRNHISTYEE